MPFLNDDQKKIISDIFFHLLSLQKLMFNAPEINVVMKILPTEKL